MVFDEVLPGLFRIEVPLPHSPLKSINSWVIPGGSRTLVIDTGMNRPECEDVLRSGLDELGVNLDRTDFFITHMHADHIGLVSALHRPGTRALIGAHEAAILERWTGPEQFFKYMESESARLGFPAEEIERAKREHPGVRFSPRSYPPFVHVDEGDEIEAGSYRFRAVETPGHTPGHMCLWDEERRLLISGDHILGDITPNITSWPDLDDALGAYLTSLRKVARLGAKLALPGHRLVIRDVAGRIRQLEDHHAARLDEVIALLGDRPLSAYEIASKMIWDIDLDDWERFPVAQKWFATGEASSHLEHLRVLGRIVFDPDANCWRLTAST
jgi:glyoxylase-like metal-dependent hydrolase (beta-lactamase superfamily II)